MAQARISAASLFASIVFPCLSLPAVERVSPQMVFQAEFSKTDLPQNSE